MPAPPASSLFEHQPHPDPHTARVRIRTDQRSPHPISRLLTGKFCEHLGTNIDHGMLAQILHNPTFAEEAFPTGGHSPDGRTLLHCDPEPIARNLRRRAADLGWPDAACEDAVTAYRESFAPGWIREGRPDQVEASPDTGPCGGRAQRIEVSAEGGGIAQWTALPLHRTRRYAFALVARSAGVPSVTASLFLEGRREPIAQATLGGLGDGWTRLEAALEVPGSVPDDAVVRFVIAAPGPGQLVLARATLLPEDHISGFDPDVVRLLRGSQLPILRWPGGNFVSGYRWEDGIGPVEGRPTRPNPAWGGVEPNIFGTDEFMAFCAAVGCEPMICVNAGDGTPEEAARWVEYCNGAADTPMGALRARNGHPDPYAVRHWEIGNELWGRWQIHWTTPIGYIDRYRRFAAAMLAADPTMALYACGAPVLEGERWNETLIRELAPDLPATTDHPLLGGPVSASTDPMDVYRDFMGLPRVLERRWRGLQEAMVRAGMREPELAVTELQLFARLQDQPDAVKDGEGAARPEPRLTMERLVTPATQCEAVYDVLIYHAAVRLAPFIRLITHSATVNHGGGLRKQRERVFANPCHYAQAMFAQLAGATPVGVAVQSAVERTPGVLPSLRRAGEAEEYPAVDALAAVGEDGTLWVSLVHCGGPGPIRTAVEWEGFEAGREARVETVSADHPWSANTRLEPQAVHPSEAVVPTGEKGLELTLDPWSVTLLRVPPAGDRAGCRRRSGPTCVTP